MTTVQSDPSADTQGVSAKPVSDTGLMCLCSIVTYHQVAVDPAQVRHQYGNESEPFNDTNILRAAQTLGFRARAVESTFERLNNSLLPAIASTHDGRYFIILKVIDDKDVPKAVVRFLDESSNKTLDKEVLDSLWNGQLILLTRRGGWAKTLQQHFDIRWFIPSFVKYRKLFGEVIIASFFLQLFALVLPVFFQVVTDKVLVHRGYTTLDVLAVGFLVVAVFDALLSGIRNYTFAHTTNRIDVELGAKLYNHLLGLPLAYFESRQVGQSVARVRELDSIRNFITGTGLTLVIDLFFTFVFFILMWYYSPALTCVVLGTIPFFVILSIFITPILRHRLDEKFAHGAANQSFLVESITGVETVKAMAVEPQMQRRWEDQLAKYVSSAFRVQSLSNVANQIAGFLNKIMTLGIIWYGAHLVMDGVMSVGQLVAFNMLAGRVSGPILKLVNLWQDFQQASISVARLGDILNTPREPGFNPNRSSLPELKGKIEFEHVKFRYRSDGPAILDDVSFTIKPGEVIGVVGKSGSGKSTVAKLIQRLYIPEAGRVMVDGVDLATMDTTFLRQNIGVVLQENFLMNRTVRENISLRNAGLPMEMVVNAAKLAGAHEFIAELPEAYDTMVGEHGSNLSGGQRQRIAIARALISNPRILLFDEATSALDYESERVIQDNMRHICHNRTVFIIAHRLSTVRQADRIIVMERGRIIEQGSHDELLALNGYYAKLNNYQNESPPIRPAPVTTPPGSTATGPTVTASREGLVKLVQRSKANPDKNSDETPA